MEWRDERRKLHCWQQQCPLLCVLQRAKRRKSPSCRVRSWIQRRDDSGFANALIWELECEDTQYTSPCFEWTRRASSYYLELLDGPYVRLVRTGLNSTCTLTVHQRHQRTDRQTDGRTNVRTDKHTDDLLYEHRGNKTLKHFTIFLQMFYFACNHHLTGKW